VGQMRSRDPSAREDTEAPAEGGCAVRRTRGLALDHIPAERGGVTGSAT
jgi:hypothetical protein